MDVVITRKYNSLSQLPLRHGCLDCSHQNCLAVATGHVTDMRNTIILEDPNFPSECTVTPSSHTVPLRSVLFSPLEFGTLLLSSDISGKICVYSTREFAVNEYSPAYKVRAPGLLDVQWLRPTCTSRRISRDSSCDISSHKSLRPVFPLGCPAFVTVCDNGDVNIHCELIPGERLSAFSSKLPNDTLLGAAVCGVSSSCIRIAVKESKRRLALYDVEVLSQKPEVKKRGFIPVKNDRKILMFGFIEAEMGNEVFVLEEGDEEEVILCASLFRFDAEQEFSPSVNIVMSCHRNDSSSNFSKQPWNQKVNVNINSSDESSALPVFISRESNEKTPHESVNDAEKCIDCTCFAFTSRRRFLLCGFGSGHIQLRDGQSLLLLAVLDTSPSIIEEEKMDISPKRRKHEQTSTEKMTPNQIPVTAIAFSANDMATFVLCADGRLLTCLWNHLYTRGLPYNKVRSVFAEYTERCIAKMTDMFDVVLFAKCFVEKFPENDVVGDLLQTINDTQALQKARGVPHAAENKIDFERTRTMERHLKSLTETHKYLALRLDSLFMFQSAVDLFGYVLPSYTQITREYAESSNGDESLHELFHKYELSTKEGQLRRLTDDQYIQILPYAEWFIVLLKFVICSVCLAIKKTEGGESVSLNDFPLMGFLDRPQILSHSMSFLQQCWLISLSHGESRKESLQLSVKYFMEHKKEEIAAHFSRWIKDESTPKTASRLRKPNFSTNELFLLHRFVILLRTKLKSDKNEHVTSEDVVSAVKHIIGTPDQAVWMEKATSGSTVQYFSLLDLLPNYSGNLLFGNPLQNANFLSGVDSVARLPINRSVSHRRCVRCSRVSLNPAQYDKVETRLWILRAFMSSCPVCKGPLWSVIVPSGEAKKQ